VSAPFVESAPVIDGSLDERVWQAAAVLDGFVQTRPGDNTPPSQPTSILVGYDDSALYIGVRATDDPRSVRATLAKRDNVLADDHVRIFLDTFHDQRRAYLLAFNPLGVQQDGIWTEGADPDYSVDVVMESRGRLTGSGYEIEVRIPFRSLRYAAGKNRSWGLQVQRYIKHANDEEDSWRPLIRGQASFLAQAGTLHGLTRIAPERSVELIPTLVTTQFGRRVDTGTAAGAASRRFVEDPVAVQASLTAKASLSSSLVLDATLNPDFAQVEADDLVVTANQRFPLFFEEKRPFFLEGIDLLKTPLQLVDTRRIVDPDFAAKVTGKAGADAFALLLASDAAPGQLAEEPLTGRNAHSAIARWRRDVGTGSNLGALVTLRRFPDRENIVASADGRFQLDAGTVLTLQGAGTWSRSGIDDAAGTSRDAGVGYRARAIRKTRHTTVTLNADGRSPGYAADLGYTLQTDAMNWSLDTRYDSEPKPEGRLISWSLIHTGLVQNDWKGRVKYAYTYPGFELSFPRQTKLLFRAYADYLRLFEEEFGGPFFGSPERQTVYTGYFAQLDSTPTRAWSLSLVISHSWDTFDYDFGGGPKYPRVSPAALADPTAPLDPGPATSSYYQAKLEWKPTDAFRTSFSYTKSRLVRDDTRLTVFDQDLYSLQTTRQFGRFGFCRVRADVDSLESRIRAQVVAGWTPNPGTAIYVGYDDEMRHNGFNPLTGVPEPGLIRSGRTLFLKLSYLLRRSL
jgi:Domain of unknown function (DUF5916)/Carbohydrate family 9 binding domain-like